MKSKTPKVLHELCGRSLVGHVVSAARELDPRHLCVVVGHAREQVAAHLEEHFAGTRTAVQYEQNGTGHAVRMALEELGRDQVDGTVVVVCGDTPLLSGETLRALAATHAADGNAVTVLTAEVPDSTGYGRIVRDPASGAVTAIVEHKDATEEQRAVKEINSGVFAFDGALLADALTRVRTDNSQGEEYLTDVLGILREAGHRVGACVAVDHRDPGDQQPGAVGRGAGADEPAAARGGDDGGCDRGGSGVGAGGRDGDVRAGRGGASGYAAAGCHASGGGLEVGPNTRLRDTVVGAGARVECTVADSAVVGEGGGGAVRVSPAGYAAGCEEQGRYVRRDEERDDR